MERHEMVGPLLHPIVGDATEIHRLAADLEGGEIADLGEVAGVLLGQRGENVARDELARPGRGPAWRRTSTSRRTPSRASPKRPCRRGKRRSDCAPSPRRGDGRGLRSRRGKRRARQRAGVPSDSWARRLAKLRRRGAFPREGGRGARLLWPAILSLPVRTSPSTPSFPESPCRRAGVASLARKVRRQRGRPVGLAFL